MSKLKIQIILGSTREGRHGKKVADWIADLAKKRTDFELEFIDLKDWSINFIKSKNGLKK